MIRDCQQDAMGRNWWARFNSRHQLWTVKCNGVVMADYATEAAALARVKAETVGEPMSHADFEVAQAASRKVQAAHNNAVHRQWYCMEVL